MRLSVKELADISDRASSLGERLAGGWLASGDHAAVASRRLTRWRQLAGEDYPRQLSAMLRASGKEALSDSELLRLLGPGRLKTDVPTAEWTGCLNEIIEWVSKTFADAKPGFMPDTSGVPYEHLYWPVAEFAWEQVVSRCGPGGSSFGGKARYGLQKHLVRRIAHVASIAFHPLFLAHKSFAASSMMRLLFDFAAPNGAGGNAARHYAGFVSEQGQEGLRPLFKRYPVVARLIATVTRFWIDFVSEFLGRLHSDHNELATRFGVHATPVQACSVQVGISDPHGGGRSVLILGFRNGLRLVYKPRPVGIDHAFYRLVEEINGRQPDPGLGVLKVLDRDGYGWVEFARRVPCSDRHAAKRYYRRAGSLAYLAHWLQGIDFHRENVVAAGEYPMLVDLECLAHPLRLDEVSLAENHPTSALSQSVLRTGLLPMWQSRMAGGAFYDTCGLDGAVSRQSFVPVLRWEKKNTDAMSWLHKPWRHCHRNHRPLLDGHLLSLAAFGRNVLAGYREMAALLEDCADTDLRSCRERIYEAAARRIKRPTLVYGLLLRSSLAPAVLSEGVDRSIELMALPCADGDPDWIEEISSLEVLDIPYFHFPAKTKAAQVGIQPACPLRQMSTLRSAIRRQVRLKEGEIVVGVRAGRPRAQPRNRTITPGR